MQTLCLHHNDADGRASAAIVRRALGADVQLYEMDYGNFLPLEQVLVSEQIIVVDFSLPREDMQRLAAYHQFTWIDHHKSAIDELAEIASEWPGIRDTREAACVLTWKYFFPDQPIPRAIVLIGDRDIWRWAEADTGSFNEGLHQLNTHPRNDKFWVPLLDNDTKTVSRIIAQGEILREARLREIHRSITSCGFPVSFEGYPTLAVNLHGSGDIGQQIRNMGYRIAYCYMDSVQNGRLTTFVTLYSAEVDVSKIACQFGGGGHAGAAGFHFERGPSPFPPGAQVEIEVRV
ncbi:MAG: hypothetical protein KKD28_03050 [Chloroflexi bacterium]|nr:hypothetical protein [Chloroflexota bacterium]MBU1660431.1 hypothetical protein [Chloroflexota bacterium]